MFQKITSQNNLKVLKINIDNHLNISRAADEAMFVLSVWCVGRSEKNKRRRIFFVGG